VEAFIVIRTYAWNSGPESPQETAKPYGHVVSVHMSRKKANREAHRQDRKARKYGDGESLTYEFWHSVVKTIVTP